MSSNISYGISKARDKVYEIIAAGVDDDDTAHELFDALRCLDRAWKASLKASE